MSDLYLKNNSKYFYSFLKQKNDLFHLTYSLISNNNFSIPMSNISANQSYQLEDLNSKFYAIKLRAKIYRFCSAMMILFLNLSKKIMLLLLCWISFQLIMLPWFPSQNYDITRNATVGYILSESCDCLFFRTFSCLFLKILTLSIAFFLWRWFYSGKNIYVFCIFKMLLIREGVKVLSH